MKWTAPSPVPFRQTLGRHAPISTNAAAIVELGRWGGGRTYDLLFQDATTLLVATADGIHVRDAETLALRAKWVGDHAVHGLRRAPDGALWAILRHPTAWALHVLAADGAPGPIRWQCPVDDNGIAFGFSRAGGYLAVVSADTIDVVDVAAGEVLQHTRLSEASAPQSVVVTDDGAVVLASTERGLVRTERAGGDVNVKSRAQGLGGERSTLLWLPDGRLARLSRHVDILSLDMERIESFKLPYFAEGGAVSPDGTHAVFTSIFDRLYVCDLPSLVCTRELALAPWSNSAGRHDPAPVAVSDTHGAFVVAREGRLCVFQLADGAEVASVRGYGAEGFVDLAVDERGTRILVNPSYEEPLLLDVATGEGRALALDRSRRVFSEKVESAGVLPGGDEVVIVWGESLRSKEVLHLRVSTDELVASSKARTDAPCLVVLPNGAGWASAQRTSSMLGNGTHDLKIYLKGRKSAVTTAATDYPRGLSISDDGKRLAASGVRVFDLAGAKVTGERKVETGKTSAFTLSPDGHSLVTVGYNADNSGMAVRAWSDDDNFGSRKWELDLPGKGRDVCVAWVGAFVFVGLNDGRLLVVDPAGPALLRSIDAHSDGIQALVRAAGLLWSAGKDGLVRAWGVSS